MNARSAALVLAASLLLPGLAAAATGVPARRIALVVGANRGADRVPLRWAVADAERFASLMTEMGGVAPGDCIVLREPTRRALLDGLAVVRGRASEPRAGGRAEVVVYYSGHADEKGLLLGRETLSYRELKDAMHGITADVGIGILDACASGVITRLKGGRLQPGFLTDEAMQMKGYAFLTSSSEDEAAQESERIRGSYFTHALVTGLRGAADSTGDGRVTLNEAYQYAFNETLSQTAATQGGAQHPSYDIRMAGTGDVVITDVRENSCSIVLGPEFDGRFYVRNAKRVLVAELYKPAGRTVELGLEPGSYDIHYEQEPQLLDTSISLVDGERKTVERAAFRPVKRQATQKRGGEEEEQEGSKGLLMDGRTRVEFFGGFTDGYVVAETDFGAHRGRRRTGWHGLRSLDPRGCGPRLPVPGDGHGREHGRLRCVRLLGRPRLAGPAVRRTLLLAEGDLRRQLPALPGRRDRPVHGVPRVRGSGGRRGAPREHALRRPARGRCRLPAQPAVLAGRQARSDLPQRSRHVLRRDLRLRLRLGQGRRS